MTAAGALIATWLLPETRHQVMDDTQPHQIVPPATDIAAVPFGEKADARPAGTEFPPPLAPRPSRGPRLWGVR